MKSALGAILGAAAGLLIGFIIWGGAHDAAPREGDRSSRSEGPKRGDGDPATAPSGRPPAATKIAGRGLLPIGGGQYLEGAWDGKGRFVVLSRCNEVGVGAGSGPILVPRDVEELVWHDSVTFLNRIDALAVIDRLIPEPGG